MATIRAGIVFIYWAQVFLFVPLLMGEMASGAAPAWITVVCQNADRRLKLGGAVFCATVYFVYCYALLTIAYYAIRLVLQKRDAAYFVVIIDLLDLGDIFRVAPVAPRRGAPDTQTELDPIHSSHGRDVAPPLPVTT